MKKSFKNMDIASIYVVLLAIALGAFVRFTPVISADFPLNDGGLIYVLTNDLRQNHYVLPASTTYNAANIPFAYPPLGFYLLAVIADISGINLLDIMRVLPAIISTLSILAFYCVARVLLPSKSKTALAVLSFTFVPRSYEWLIMGGGITRSLGFFFSLLTITLVYLLYTRGNKKILLATILSASLTVLSHPESSWFVVYTAALLFLFFGRNLAGVLRSLAVAVGVLAVTAFWWVNIILTHGIRPLTAATGSHFGSSWIGLLTFDITDEPFLGLVAVLGLLGLFWCITKKQFLLPLWLVIILMLESRSANTMAMVPLSILASIGIYEFILRPFANRNKPLFEDIKVNTSWAEDLLQTCAAKVILAFFIFYILGSSFIFVLVSPLYKELPREERKSMEWIKGNTPPDSRFLVISGSPWWQDASAEWFPVLAERTSILTVQGAEWLPANEFKHRWDQNDAIQYCSLLDIHCVEQQISEDKASFDYIYVSDHYINGLFSSPKKAELADLDHFPKLYYSLKSSPNYTLVYEDNGVAVFNLKGEIP